MNDISGHHAVVLGGAGFLGSHLCDRLLEYGSRVTVLDNLITGNLDNLSHLVGRPGFLFRDQDVACSVDVEGEVDYVIHFASPASPVDYMRWPIQTLEAGSLGTFRALDLALAKNALFLLASTSEVYGDPLVNPQPEAYWGHVNPIGPRSPYDEAKRFAEALTLAYHRDRHVGVRIARIFNTYGPRMRLDDGRAVPAFFKAALANEPLPVHGDGTQTRSLCYVDDLIEGILKLLASTYVGPVNIGNPEEVTIMQLADAIQSAVDNHPGVAFHPRPKDDPTVRCPDTTVAELELGWRAKVSLKDGLAKAVPWFREQAGRFGW